MASNNLNHEDTNTAEEYVSDGEGRNSNSAATGTTFPSFPSDSYTLDATPSGQVQFRLPFPRADNQTSVVTRTKDSDVTCGRERQNLECHEQT